MENAEGVVHQSAFSSTVRFANYDLNHYSSLLSKRIARESWNGGEIAYKFVEWQAAQAAGSARNLDPNGKQTSRANYTNFQVQGSSLITSDVKIGSSGWRVWTDGTPKGTISAEACGMLPCVRMIAGATPSLLMSPNFSVEVSRWYRLTFDLKTGIDNQRILIAPRRGGGGNNGQELFTHGTTIIHGTRSWKRNTLLIEATLGIKKGDPVTGDAGARIDFLVKPGEEITIANVELVPLLKVGGELRTALLSNASDVQTQIACPDVDSAPTACDQYVSFTTGAPVNWPHPVAPYSSEIVFTRNWTLTDSDADGIADIQDQCRETPLESAVNSLGCSFQLDS